MKTTVAHERAYSPRRSLAWMEICH